jgi:hypothetical protein
MSDDLFILTFLNLALLSGFNFGYSAWINSKFLGSGQGTNSYFGGIDLRNGSWAFSVEDLHEDDNILTVVLDPTGEFWSSIFKLTTYASLVPRSRGRL